VVSVYYKVFLLVPHLKFSPPDPGTHLSGAEQVLYFLEDVGIHSRDVLRAIKFQQDGCRLKIYSRRLQQVSFNILRFRIQTLEGRSFIAGTKAAHGDLEVPETTCRLVVRIAEENPFVEKRVKRLKVD
jgi:hypothetical protein